MLAAEAPPDAFGIAIGRHATVDSIISVTRLIPCAGAQYVTPADKNMLLCEAAANGKLMKEYGRPPRSRRRRLACPVRTPVVGAWIGVGIGGRGHMARSEIRMVWRWDYSEYSLVCGGGERGWVCG